MKKQFNVRICKTDAALQEATAAVYSPMKLDSQGDFMTIPGVKAAQQGSMKAGRTFVDKNHDGLPLNAFVSE